jgi:hypothetical protein
MPCPRGSEIASTARLYGDHEPDFVKSRAGLAAERDMLKVVKAGIAPTTKTVVGRSCLGGLVGYAERRFGCSWAGVACRKRENHGG